METDPTELCVEELTQRLVTADAILVPADSDIAFRWEDDLGALITTVGLNTKFEGPDDAPGKGLTLTSVAFGVDDPAGGSPAHPDHYGGDWYRVRLVRAYDAAAGCDLIHLPYPPALALAACEHFDIVPPPGLSSEPRPPHEPDVPAQLRALTDAVCETKRAAAQLLGSTAQALDWAHTTATVAARQRLPAALVSIRRSALGSELDTVSPAAAILWPTSRCHACDTGRPDDQTLNEGSWACERCGTPNAARPIAAVALDGPDLDRAAHDPQPCYVPHTDVIEAVTELGVESHLARQHVHGAAGAWDLAARIGTELWQLAERLGDIPGADTLQRWVNDTTAGSLAHAPEALMIHNDYRWGGIHDIGRIRPLEPIVAWNPDHHYLTIAHAGTNPGHWTAEARNITRITAESAEHPGSVVTVARAAAAAMRAQLPTAGSPPQYGITWDPDRPQPPRCRITQPDAHQIDYPHRPALGQPLGMTAAHDTGAADFGWAHDAFVQARSDAGLTL